MVLTTMKSGYSTANIQPDKTKDAPAAIEQIWNRLYPDFVFEYSFIDQTVADHYKLENQPSQLYKLFSSIAIFRSCPGLNGLIAFLALRRTGFFFRNIGLFRNLLILQPAQILFQEFGEGRVISWLAGFIDLTLISPCQLNYPVCEYLGV